VPCRGAGGALAFLIFRIDGFNHLFGPFAAPDRDGTLPRMIQEWRGRKLAA
jgi:hypothetical protein